MFTKRALRFTLSGIFVTALHIVIATAFIELILPQPALANGVAFLIATLTSYLINTIWSFSSRLHGKTLFRFSLVSFFGLFLSVAISGAAQAYGLPYWYGIAAVTCVVPPTNFVLHNFWTYR
jgi:putative flippase GtrA